MLIILTGIELLIQLVIHNRFIIIVYLYSYIYLHLYLYIKIKKVELLKKLNY